MIGNIVGVISVVLFLINTVICCSLFYIVAIPKLLVPNKSWRLYWSKIMAVVAEQYHANNNLIEALTQKIHWDIELPDNLSREKSYIVLSNHRSWVDIVVLGKVLNRKIPLTRYFIKKELLWVPLLGLVWWFLDFPTMHRFSKEYLRQHPEMTGKDVEKTRKCCERMKDLPTSILIFAEGTRFTEQKHETQNSPFNNLLTPKTGGLFTVLQAMGEQFDSILDVTLSYTWSKPGFWGLFSRGISEIKVRVVKYPISDVYEADKWKRGEVSYEDLKLALNQIWTKKDQLLDRL